MANEIQYRNHTAYNNGTSAENNIKLLDITPFQHEDLSSGVNKLGKMLVAQSFCEPVAVCNSNNPQNGAYVATCQNYPDFALSYQDAQQNTQYLIGLKIRVIFTYGITYGSVSGGTYPTLNINGSGAIPMLAQGKTMATGSASAGQTLEFTVIPYGNGVAFDADSNVRESTSDYTIYTDGLKRINSVTNNDKNMVTSGAVYSEISKTKDFWNLRVKAATPTTATTETLYNSRKFSDYYWILIDVGTGAYNTRETLLVPSSKVMQTSTIYVFTTIAGNREEIDIEILSDTQLKISSTSNTAYTGIYGFIQK